MCYWQDEREQDLDQLLRIFCSSPCPVSQPLFNIAPIQYLTSYQPVFKISQRKPISNIPLKKQTRITKHYCSYIIKRTIRQMANPIFKTEVSKILTKHCQSISSIEGLICKLESVTGPVRFLQIMKSAQKAHKDVFLQFCQWYLQKRYIRYLLKEGKIEERERYVHFKNTEMKKLLRKAGSLQL